LGWIDGYVSWTTSGPKWRLILGCSLAAFAVATAIGAVVGGGTTESRLNARLLEDIDNSLGIGDLPEELFEAGEDFASGAFEGGEDFATDVIDELGAVQAEEPVDGGATTSIRLPGSSHLISLAALLVMVAALHIAVSLLVSDPEPQSRPNDARGRR